MTLGTWLRSASERLEANGVEAFRLEAQVLAGFALHQERSWVLAHPEFELSAPNVIESLLARRLRHEPLAYITGVREFYGRPFQVRPGVLIPRQETETLVEVALAAIDRLQTKTVLDVGIGSGAIALTLKAERQDIAVTAVEISAAALEVAQKNAVALKVDVEILESDLFAALGTRRFDLIVSNPPYIGREENLVPEVRDHEPEQALFAGKEGLDIYERLALEAETYLTPDGEVWMEIGFEQEKAVSLLWKAHGWRGIGSAKDLLGHVRVLGFQPRAGSSLP